MFHDFTLMLYTYRLYGYSTFIIIMVVSVLWLRKNHTDAKTIRNHLINAPKKDKKQLLQTYKQAPKNEQYLFKEVSGRVWLNATYIRPLTPNERKFYDDKRKTNGRK